MSNSFWDTFWIAMIFVPLALLWCFGLMDVFRRQDMNGATKALWVIAFFVFPWIGVLVYLVTRRPGGIEEDRKTLALSESGYMQKYAPSTAEELEKLAGLRDKGIITDAEFQAQKAKILADATEAVANAAPAPAPVAAAAPPAGPAATA